MSEVPACCKLWCGKRNFLHPSAGRAALLCLSSRESAYPCRRRGLGPWVGKIPWMRKRQALQCSGLESSMDRGARGAAVYGVAQSQARTLSPQSCLTLCDPVVSRPPAALSTGLSRQEHWSGSPVPFPYGMLVSKSKVAQACPTLCDPVDCSPPGSSVHGIFQARALEQVAICFSKSQAGLSN